LIASGLSFSLISEAVSETALRSSLTVLVSPSRVRSVSCRISFTERLPSEVMLSPPSLLSAQSASYRVVPSMQEIRCEIINSAGAEFRWIASSTQGWRETACIGSSLFSGIEKRRGRGGFPALSLIPTG
jgi:hypothetical protein